MKGYTEYKLVIPILVGTYEILAITGTLSSIGYLSSNKEKEIYFHALGYKFIGAFIGGMGGDYLIRTNKLDLLSWVYIDFDAVEVIP